MDLLTLIGYTSSKNLWLLVFVYARFLSAMMICPIFTNTYISATLRNCLALLFAVIIFPWFKHLEISNNIITNIMLTICNALYGSLIGYLLSLPLWLIEATGSIIDMQRGEQIGALINNQTRNVSSSVGKLLSKTFMTYLIVNNGIIFFINTVFNSFTLAPPNSLFPIINDFYMKTYMHLINEYCLWVIIFALPVITILFMVDFSISMISALIPQLNATVFSMPIKALVAILVLIFYCELLMHQIFNKFIIQINYIFS